MRSTYLSFFGLSLPSSTPVTIIEGAVTSLLAHSIEQAERQPSLNPYSDTAGGETSKFNRTSPISDQNSLLAQTLLGVDPDLALLYDLVYTPLSTVTTIKSNSESYKVQKWSNPVKPGDHSASAASTCRRVLGAFLSVSLLLGGLIPSKQQT